MKKMLIYYLNISAFFVEKITIVLFVILWIQG